MGFFWEDCFLCNGYGKFIIGDNFNKFHKPKDKDCPMCDGKGRCSIKWTVPKVWENRLRNQL